MSEFVVDISKVLVAEKGAIKWVELKLKLKLNLRRTILGLHKKMGGIRMKRKT